VPKKKTPQEEKLQSNPLTYKKKKRNKNKKFISYKIYSIYLKKKNIYIKKVIDNTSNKCKDNIKSCKLKYLKKNKNNKNK
jgi:hypothetical protein